MRDDPDPGTYRSHDGSTPHDGKDSGRVALALALGLVVLPVQFGLLLLWGAATDVPVVEALAQLLDMTSSGLVGYYLLIGLSVLLFAIVSFAATFAVSYGVLRSGKLALLTLGSSLVVTVVTGVAVGLDRSTRTESLLSQTETLNQRAEEHVRTLRSGTSVQSVSVEPGPPYASMGATTSNPRPEWGELYWSVRVRFDLEVPFPSRYELTIEYWLPEEEVPHARLERELDLEAGWNPLVVTLDTNQTRSYQGFWSPKRSGGSLVLVLRTVVSPEQLYGDEADDLERDAEQLFGEAAGELEPTSRSVELLREKFDLDTGTRLPDGPETGDPPGEASSHDSAGMGQWTSVRSSCGTSRTSRRSR